MLYHYTTIEVLALILRNRTIRFTQLTKVDDPHEYNTIQDGVNPANYVFVSCWTSSRQENIPQWKMYARKGRGVRIGMDEQMFCVKKFDGEHLNLFPNEYFQNKDYIIAPILSFEDFLSDMVYTKQNKVKQNEIFTKVGYQSAVDFRKIGIYKSDDWAFQKEKRFRINVIPKKNGRIPNNFLGNAMTPNVSYIDIPIVDNVFREMEIVIGPYMSDAERILTKALICKYVENPKVCESAFSNYKVNE